MAQTNPPFMSGVPELLVLRLLASREMYGYEIVKAVRLVTGEALHSLEESGALKARRKEIKGRTRVYYSVTPKGQRRLEHLSGEWQRVSTGVNSALGAPKGAAGNA